MENQILFLERFKLALKLKNIKQIELAEITGLSRGIISNYYSGKVLPKSNNLYLIANALDVNPAWLIGFNVPMDPDVCSVEEKLINTIKKLPFTEQEKILNIINILYPNIDKEDEKNK